MAIDIKTEEEKKINLPSSFNALFYYSIILLLVTLSGYLLIYQWNLELNQQIEKKEEIIKNLKNNNALKANQKSIFDAKNKIDNYFFLLSNNKSIDQVFLFLENMIHPLASVEEISLSKNDNLLQITGYALDYEVLEEQYTILKNFNMDRNLSGWVFEDKIKESESDKLLIDSGALRVYKDPIITEKVTNEIESVLNRKLENNLTQDEQKKLDQELDLAKTKEQQNIKTVIKNKEGSEVEVLSKPDLSDYNFGKENYKMLNKDWYEVVVSQTIEPVKQVELVKALETDDDDFSVNFKFNIILNPIIFKK